MKLTSREVLTVPNVMTGGRLATIPWLYKRIKANPGRNWWNAGVVAGLDKADGFVAGLEDVHPLFATLRFCRSELGRKGDPTVDAVFGAAMIHAGMEGGAIPRWMGRLSIGQKVAKAGISADAARRGIDVHVTAAGALGEACTVAGFGFRMGAEGVKHPVARGVARISTDALALTGIAMATIAMVDYGRQSGRLPEERTAVERAVEVGADRVLQLHRVFHSPTPETAEPLAA